MNTLSDEQGTKMLKDYCLKVDELKQRKDDFKLTIEKDEKSIAVMRELLIPFLAANQDKDYLINGKRVSLTTTNKKTPFNEKFINEHLPEVMDEARAEEIISSLQSKREISEMYAITRRAVKKTKGSADDNEEE